MAVEDGARVKQEMDIEYVKQSTPKEEGQVKEDKHEEAEMKGTQAPRSGAERAKLSVPFHPDFVKETTTAIVKKGGVTEDRRLSSIMLEDGDFPEECDWYLVGGAVVQGLSTTKGRKLVDNEIVHFTFPSSKSRLLQWILFASLPKDTERIYIAISNDTITEETKIKQNTGHRGTITEENKNAGKHTEAGKHNAGKRTSAG
ncbi:uncharacterized protein LOC110815864 isoform X2 [Carica papaya]|nr:uncharacterized protein LOC110815864 isoform X2 [Carica papaya]